MARQAWAEPSSCRRGRPLPSSSQQQQQQQQQQQHGDAFDTAVDARVLLEPEMLAAWQRRLGGVAYTRPASASGLAAMKLVEEWMTNASLGTDGKSFAVLYDLLTNALNIKIMIDDSSQALGALLTRLVAPRIPEELLLVLRALEANAALAARMPRYKGAAGGLKLFQKKSKGMPEELHMALIELVPQLAPDALAPPPPYAPPALVAPPLSELRRVHRVWLPVAQLQSDQHMRPAPPLIMGPDASLVLAPMVPSEYIERRSTSAVTHMHQVAKSRRGMTDLRRTPSSGSASTATRSRSRSSRSGCSAASSRTRRRSSSRRPKGAEAAFVLRERLTRATGGGDATAAAAAAPADDDAGRARMRRELVEALVFALAELRRADDAIVDSELPALLSFHGCEATPERALHARALAQQAGSEPTLSLELLGRLLMSSRGEDELRILYPPMSADAARGLLSRASTLLLIMSRITYVARTLKLARRLLAPFAAAPPSPPPAAHVEARPRGDGERQPAPR